ncbi:hypothetical protein IU487_14200 [Nocardia puris]|uniref:hypothetical protein n=1 Tax=Nocardia puris TaxID=208602 RepID=UPI0018960BBC|nr:hypothetical protein [Nocardia puris]MBF6212185.1 hypothetical protein [Nocardia puris]
MSRTFAPAPVQPPSRERHLAAPGPRSAKSHVDEYRTAYRLPARIDPATGQITMRAGKIVGVMMPADLGAQLYAALAETGDAGGPIVSHPRSQTWTFLTQRDHEPDDLAAHTGGWWRHRVSVLTANAHIGLPGPHPGGVARREWIVAPSSHLRPPTTVVIAELNAILSSGGPR